MSDVNIKDEMNQIGDALGRLNHASGVIGVHAQNLERERNELREKSTRLQRATDEACKQAAHAESAFARVCKERDDMARMGEEAHQQCDKLREELAVTKSARDIFQNSLIDARAALNDVSAERDRLKNELANAKAHAENTTRNYEASQKSSNLLRAALNDVSAERDRLKNERDEAIKRVTSLQDSLKITLNERDHALNSLETCTRDCDALRLTVENVIGERNDIIKLRDAAEQSLRNMINTTDMLRRELGEHITGKLDRDDKITRLERALDEAALRVSTQSQVIANLQNVLVMVNAVLSVLKDPDLHTLAQAISKLLDATKSSDGTR